MNCKKIISLIFLFGIILSSCTSFPEISKRHYRNGYYVKAEGKSDFNIPRKDSVHLKSDFTKLNGDESKKLSSTIISVKEKEVSEYSLIQKTGSHKINKSVSLVRKTKSTQLLHRSQKIIRRKYFSKSRAALVPDGFWWTLGRAFLTLLLLGSTWVLRCVAFLGSWWIALALLLAIGVAALAFKLYLDASDNNDGNLYLASAPRGFNILTQVFAVIIIIIGLLPVTFIPLLFLLALAASFK